MKKLKTFVEVVVVVATLPVLIFAEINYATINPGQNKNVPVGKKHTTINQDTLNTGLPGLLNTKFIVIKY